MDFFPGVYFGKVFCSGAGNVTISEKFPRGLPGGMFMLRID